MLSISSAARIARSSRFATRALATRVPIVGGNWKCNPKTPEEIPALIANINACDTSGCEVYVCPSPLHVGLVQGKLTNSAVVAPQNCNFSGCGAYTGEMAVDQMAAMGISWVLLGHSERRGEFGLPTPKESNELLATKLAYVLEKGLNCSDSNFASLPDAFLVLFFLLMDGYVVDEQWFEPGKLQLMPVVFFCYIAFIYFVLLNVFVAVVLDVYATTPHAVRRAQADGQPRKNPMMVFLVTFILRAQGKTMVKDEVDHNLRSEDLSIRLSLLPGIVQRKYIEKKRKMQRVASENFEGMELYPPDALAIKPGSTMTGAEWALPTTELNVVERMQSSDEQGPVPVYDVPPAMKHDPVTVEQLQRLMNEDSTLPLLLGSGDAVEVIRRFRDQDEEPASDDAPSALKTLQGYVFGKVADLEKVKVDDDPPKVPQIDALTEEMSGSLTDVRNHFRLELTGIIEATGTLFEQLVELTQSMNTVRDDHEGVVKVMRKRFGTRSM